MNPDLTDRTSDISDRILEWVSEKGEGNLEDFKRAWEWLSVGDGEKGYFDAGKAWIELSDLAALGHVEIMWDGDNPWAVSRPALTMLPNSGCRAVLVGARTKALLEDDPRGIASGKGIINRLYAEEEIGFDIDFLQSQKYGRGGPAAVIVAGETRDEIKRLAEASGIDFTQSVSQELGAMFPPLDRYAAQWPERPMPQGHPLRQLDIERMQWPTCPEQDEYPPGLYRAEVGWDTIHILRTATGASLEVSREHGVYECLRWTGLRVLRYSPKNREMWVPLHGRLPILQSRAAVLASGLLPRFAKRDGQPGHLYVNIDRYLAGRIAASLEQELIPDD